MTSTSDRTVAEQLDAHAKAITKLRREIRELQAAIRDSDTPADQTALAALAKPAKTGKFLGTPGTYVNNPRCLGCWQAKEHGRKYALCHSCGAAKKQAVDNGEPIPRYSTCGNCGRPLNGAIYPICGKCAPAYKKWRDNQ